MNRINDNDLLKLKEDGFSWAEIATELGFSSGEAARSYYKRVKKGERVHSLYPQSAVTDTVKELADAQENAAIEFLDRKVVRHADWQDLLSLAQHVQGIDQDADDTQKFATVRINTKDPIAVMFSGDWHLGSRADYVTWANDIHLLIDEPSLYMVDLGDDIQNMRSFKDLSGVLGQVLSPQQQAIMMKGLVNDLTDRNKLIAKVSGNHDEEFDERIFGSSVQQYLLDHMKAPRFKSRGLVKLEVGNETYTLSIFHKTRFSSYMRPAHGAYREYELFFPSDVVAGAHDHRPGLEAIWQYNFARSNGFDFGGLSYLVKVGSPQISNFGWKYFHSEQYLAPTIVFHPDSHKKLPFLDPRDAVRYIKSFKE